MSELSRESAIPRADSTTVRTEPGATDSQTGVSRLAEQLADGDVEVTRAAKRGLWQLVRHAGRPGADSERRGVADELTGLLQKEDAPPAVYREVLWMLSEIGGKDSIPAVAALLENTAVREDARMALERIPGPESLAALRLALAEAPDDFKTSLAQSLRARGEVVAGLPCEKLKPTKQTKVSAGS